MFRNYQFHHPYLCPSPSEEEEEVFGDHPWSHGLTAQNQIVLDKFVQYAHEQGYIPERRAA